MADCTGFIEPLDLSCILINTFAGSMDLFIMISIIALASMGAYFKMLNMTLLTMFILFSIIMAQYMQGIYFLVILLTGLLVAFTIGRMFKQ